ncbi:MAG TPA: RNA polymerase sigma factor [Longimicrobiaceae bacterium]|nr:RNA polymerase sigma factor [Longimicrobiaceae bacterium]
MTDRALAGRVAAGDPAAARELYDRHVDRVYRLALRLCGDVDLAQDFTQEAFLRAFDRIGGFRGDAALATWLHAITVSVTLNGMRRVRRIGAREVELGAAAGEAAAGAGDPVLRLRLAAAIDALPERHRVAFVMREMEGYTHEEIAAVLEVAPVTSRSLVARARARLRSALSGLVGGIVP